MVKALKFGIPVLFVVLVAVALVAPVGPLPGFLIGGTPTPAPETWPDTSDVDEILLEVPGTLPRVVTIWVIEVASELYVTGYTESGWVQMLGDGGLVRMRLGDETYSLTATAVTDDATPILTAYMDKYRPDYPDIVAGFPSPEEARDSYAVFRLSRS